MKGYITYYNAYLGTIYLKSLTFVNTFPIDYTYIKEEGKLFEEYDFKQISRTHHNL